MNFVNVAAYYYKFNPSVSKKSASFWKFVKKSATVLIDAICRKKIKDFSFSKIIIKLKILIATFSLQTIHQILPSLNDGG